MKNANLTAFPCPRDSDYYGITKREYFAAMALQGICASPIDPGAGTVEQIIQGDAEMAVRMADAVLAELEKMK